MRGFVSNPDEPFCLHCRRRSSQGVPAFYPGTQIYRIMEGHIQVTNGCEHFPEGKQNPDVGRNRVGVSDNADRIPCPIDGSHTIYKSKMRAHIRRCTKIRDIAYSHCLPFMVPDCNLPKRSRCENVGVADSSSRSPVLETNDHVSVPSAARLVLDEGLRNKITRAFVACGEFLRERHTLLRWQLNNMDLYSIEHGLDASQRLPALTFLEGCQRCEYQSAVTESHFTAAAAEEAPDTTRGRTIEEGKRFLLSACDACEVPLTKGVACKEMTEFLQKFKEAVNSTHDLIEPLKQLLQKLNKHQHQHFQLVALCLQHGLLRSDEINETVVIELGAGKLARVKTITVVSWPIYTMCT